MATTKGVDGMSFAHQTYKECTGRIEGSLRVLARSEGLAKMKRYRHINVLAVWLLGYFLSVPFVHAVEIRVNAGAVGSAVNPLAFGNAVIYYGSSMGFPVGITTQSEYDAAKAKWNSYLPLVNEMGPTLLRYPGGLLSNTFWWKSGIGPVSQRDQNYDRQQGGRTQIFGTDEFLQYCEEIGAQAIMTVNVSKAGARPGTVQDAADWVEYCNAPNDGSNPGGGKDWAAARAANGHKMPYGVKYWELGNEELWPSKEDYAQRVKEYSLAMKAIDSAIEIGAIRTGGGIHPLSNTENFREYQRYLLSQVGQYFDFWAHHTHPPGSSGNANGFVIVRDGAGVEVPFTVNEGASYEFVFPVEARCSFLNCPGLRFFIDGVLKQEFANLMGVTNMKTAPISLTAGTHVVRVEGFNLGESRTLNVCQQLELHKQGQSSLVLIDLKEDPALYHMVVGASMIAEKELEVGESYAGDKPVYLTETAIGYTEDRSHPLVHKVADLREGLALASLYNTYLGNGIQMINYWYLFNDCNANGVLEGVAWNSETGAMGRPDPHKRPSYHVLKAYRWNVFDELVQVTAVGSPTFTAGMQTSGLAFGFFGDDETIPYLQVLASRTTTADKLSLFVLNLDPEESYRMPVSIQGFTPGRDVTVYTITGGSPAANNEVADCPSGQCVSTATSQVTLEGNQFSYTFGKHSLTVFVFYRTGADLTAPDAPYGLIGSAGDGKVQLDWNPTVEEDLEGYNIYRSRIAEGPFNNRLNGEPVHGSDYLDQEVDNGVTHYYAVKAVDRSGNESQFSNKIRLNPQAGNGEPLPPVEGDDELPPTPPILLDIIER